MARLTAYDDAKYNVIQRRWITGGFKVGVAGTPFSLPTAMGNGTTDATSGTVVQAGYFRGPVKIIKFGAICVATGTHASSDLVPLYLKTRGASASVGCTLNIKSTSTAVALWAHASNESITSPNIKEGEYFTIRFGTPKTDKGTAANTATVLGSWALYVDFVPTYGTNWDVA